MQNGKFSCRSNSAGADVNLTAGKESSLKTAYKCCDQDVIYELLEAGADTRISGCCQCIS